MDGGGRCAKHARAAWARPAPVQRVAGRQLQAKRAALYLISPHCAMCGEPFLLRQMQRDHTIPLAEGGADDDENTQLLCLDCHAVKSKAEAARGRGRSKP